MTSDAAGWPGAPVPPPAPPPPPGSWGPPPAPPYAPPRTNTLAIISLVAGIAQFVMCLVFGAVVAIVTGHIARGQIKRTNESGRGMATAGLILGYVGVSLTALVIVAAIVVVTVFSPTWAQTSVRNDAREFTRAVVGEASLGDRTPQDAALLSRVYYLETREGGCCTSTEIHLADGTPVPLATTEDWQRARWRVELSGSIFVRKYACATIPSTVYPLTSSALDELVHDGRCPP